MKSWNVKALKISITLIGIIVLLIGIFFLPKVANYLAESYAEYAYLKYPLLIGLYTTCIPFFLGIFHTFKLLRLIERDGAFTRDACNSLGAISINTIVVLVIYIIGMVYLIINNALHPSIFLLGIVILFVTFIIYIFATILRGLLMKVVEIKNENDFTI